MSNVIQHSKLEFTRVEQSFNAYGNTLQVSELSTQENIHEWHDSPNENIRMQSINITGFNLISWYSHNTLYFRLAHTALNLGIHRSTSSCLFCSTGSSLTDKCLIQLITQPKAAGFEGEFLHTGKLISGQERFVHSIHDCWKRTTFLQQNFNNTDPMDPHKL